MRRFCPHCGAKLVAISTRGGLKRFECPEGPHRPGDDDFQT